MAYGAILGQTPTASNVTYNNSQTSSIITGTNVQQAIDQLFTSVSNGKSLIASAITDKGVSTSANDTFQQMATNISNIQTGFKITSESFSQSVSSTDWNRSWVIPLSRSGYTLWENCFVQITQFFVQWRTTSGAGGQYEYNSEIWEITLDGNQLTIPVMYAYNNLNFRYSFAEAIRCTVYYIDPA